MAFTKYAVSMLTHSLRRWPDIETSLGDCTVFSDCCIVMRVTLSTPAPETPDNKIHWLNADAVPLPAMLGQHNSNQNHLTV